MTIFPTYQSTQCLPYKSNFCERARMSYRNIKKHIIHFIVPTHLRRAIFHCSLAARLSKSDKESHEQLAQMLVRDLDLVCAYNAMLAPMSWSNRIWDKLPDGGLDTPFNASELMDWYKTIIRSAPASLVYGSPRFMCEDIAQTLRAVTRARDTSTVI